MDSKVEFQCQHCGSTLRLGSEHQGKQARCPICGVITTVPYKADSSYKPLSSPVPQSPLEHPPTKPESPAPPNPYSSPTSSAAPAQQFGTMPGNDGLWWAGLICGIVSIVSIVSSLLPCMCCFVGPMFGILSSFAGCTATVFSQIGPKWINFLLCGIGFAISLGMLVVMLLS